MSRAYSFRINFCHYTNAEHLLEVRGEYNPIIPAKLTGDPDTWSPAEGGEIEDVKIWMCQRNRLGGKRKRKLTEDLADKLFQSKGFEDSVREQIEDV